MVDIRVGNAASSNFSSGGTTLKRPEEIAETMKRLYKLPYEIVQSKEDKKQSNSLFKVIIIGDSAVGKSCLMNRVTRNEFSDDHEVTVGVEFGAFMVKLDKCIFRLQIWDTAGQENYKSITKIFYKGAHCVILAYDITRHDTFVNLESWL